MEATDKGKIGNVTFQFNPANTNEGAAVNYAMPKIPGRQTDLMKYTGGTGRAFDLKIVLDSNYAKDISYVETALSELNTYRLKGENDAPPVVLLQYGNSIYWVVVLKIEVNAMLRDSSNNITQAEVILSIKEFVDEEHHRTSREQKGQQIYFISQGENATFRSIAERLWKNASLWKAIADFNPNTLLRMDGPIIPAGERLDIPAWSIAKTYLAVERAGLVAFE